MASILPWWAGLLLFHSTLEWIWCVSLFQAVSYASVALGLSNLFHGHRTVDTTGNEICRLVRLVEEYKGKSTAIWQMIEIMLTITISGTPGSGKSTVAQILEKKLGLEYVILVKFFAN